MRIVHTVLSLGIALSLAGCRGCGQDPWQTLVYDDGTQPGGCGVFIFSPPSPQGAVVKIFWDGQLVFDGKLPPDTSGMDGVQIDLLDIRTSPGSHVLEVRHAGQSKTQSPLLIDGQIHYYYLFGHENNRPVLIEDMGTEEPLFSDVRSHPWHVPFPARGVRAGIRERSRMVLG